MTQVIIYKQDNGVLAIVWPTSEAVAALGIATIAKKDVPAGKPYKILDASDLPSSREQRDAWTVDDEDLNDGIGGGE